MGTEDFSHLVTDANRARSEADSAAIFDAAREQIERQRAHIAALPVKKVLSTYQRLTVLANRMAKLPTASEIADIAPELRPLVRRRLVAALERLETLVDQLGA